MRLLVVEDDPTVRRLIEVTVRGLGDVVVVGSEQDARLELLGQPDVVLLDLGLPHLRWDLLEEAVQAAARVVVVTGHIEPSVISRALQMGAADVVTKPFRPATLVAAASGDG
ncbi:MAG: response regulator [Acidimicrobiia bacterium]|nr:response regulator [Acidimicrobiia bacterium]